MSVKKVYRGKVDHVATSHAYILLENNEFEKDISVATKNLQGAMHSDIVEIELINTRSPRKRKEGKVVSIVKRSASPIIGHIEEKGGQTYCVPSHRRLHDPILIPEFETEGLKKGEKVVVSIVRWSTILHQSIGKIVEVLGMDGTPETETQSILAEFQLSEAFPKDIEQVVAKFPDQLSDEAIAKRRDFRNVLTFTIDPVDSKDFDDALSIEKLPNGNYRIGIHIADVTHYVQEGALLDEEACRRSTSVYLVGKVVSMLPHRLANDLCSLKPKVDRPAFSLTVELTPEARIVDSWIGETMIHSDKRFTYEEAYESIMGKKGTYYGELQIFHELAQQLRKRRMKEGSICFESTDIDIQLDKEGYPVDIKPKKSIFTHQLIEEFMLLANREVGTRIFNQKVNKKSPPFLYRVHNDPDSEKLAQFSLFVKKLGYKLDTAPAKLAQSLNALLATTQGTVHEAIIQKLMMRTMSQACYTTDPKHHFGLGFKHYTHFTSPIRRYPDLVVHRLIKHYLQGGKWPPSAMYEQVAKHASSKEREAVDAERASISSKQVLFMKKLEGEKLLGTIAGVTEWGLYVELVDSRCEGMVRISSLKGDYYSFDPANFCVEGKKSGKKFQIGNQVLVKVKDCNIERKTIDFELFE